MERGRPSQDLTLSQVENTMQYEAAAFAELIEKGDISHKGLEHSREVSRIITEARQTLGVIYPAD